MKSKRNVVVGSGVIIACAVVMLTALSRTQVAATPFRQLASSQPGERLEIYGELEPASIESIKGATTVRFDLIEEKTGERLQVVYDNPAIALPATFPAASHAKAVGTYLAADKRFVADTVFTKCPSKYKQEMQLDVTRKVAMERWEKSTGLKAASAK
jgi:cytochrome c-type biogenesis protein CcmE